MWANTLCPLVSSTRNIALGSGSTTRPSTSMAPSFFAISSAFRTVEHRRERRRLNGWAETRVLARGPGTSTATADGVRAASTNEQCYAEARAQAKRSPRDVTSDLGPPDQEAAADS